MDYDGLVEFFPLQRAEDNSLKKKIKDSKSISINKDCIDPGKIRLDETNEFCKHLLEKGKYDIDYVINLLKILIEECDRHQLNRHDLPFSLRESCKRLIGNLETEKLGKPKDPRILVTCELCKKSVVIPERIAHLWKCPCTNGIKSLEMID